MERQAFEQLVADGFEAIPERFRARVANVVFLVENEPSREVRRQEGLAKDETLLGHYQGLPLAERGDHYGVGATLPDAIVMYQHPIEEEAAALLKERGGNFIAAVREVVADTVWHEVAHHFGFDENEVRDREDRRRARGTSE